MKLDPLIEDYIRSALATRNVELIEAGDQMGDEPILHERLMMLADHPQFIVK